MGEALAFLLDNIYIRFGSKFYRQLVGIPMGTNCAPLVADLFLLYYESDFKLVVDHHTSYFIACRPKAALLFWFFGDFRCGSLLIMVVLVIYKYKNR